MNATTYQAQFVGNNHLIFDRQASTNTYAIKLLAKNNPPNGTVISALYQFEGRGQYGSTWDGESGQNIASSIILYPTKLSANRQFELSKATAIAVRDVIAYLLPAKIVTVKWPNDIYVGDKKICGILIQNILSGKFINKAVIGIGVNINQEKFEKKLQNPTSLNIESDRYFQLEEVRQLLFNAIEFWYNILESGKVSVIHQYYHQFLYKREENNKFFNTITNEVIEGMIEGVDHLGRLVIRTNREVFSFDFKEVKFIQE